MLFIFSRILINRVIYHFPTMPGLTLKALCLLYKCSTTLALHCFWCLISFLRITKFSWLRIITLWFTIVEDVSSYLLLVLFIVYCTQCTVMYCTQCTVIWLFTCCWLLFFTGDWRLRSYTVFLFFLIDT